MLGLRLVAQQLLSCTRCALTCMWRVRLVSARLQPVPTGCQSVLQVIDAEMGRRKMLEDAPVASINDDPVNFDTDEIPWWAWVQRFHLPEVS